jgi:23S rRNA pseudouridine1911/1915/1917 synthase
MTILYEDEWLIAVDKPAGVVVHPSYRNSSGTLVNGLLWHVRGRPDVRIGLLNRLDKGTSGVVLAAIGQGVHARLQKAAAGMKKQYLAIVHGVPAPRIGRITHALARDGSDRRRIVISVHGQPALTFYSVIAAAGGRSIVRCELGTGRTHQIRVHLASAGWPLVGDSVYGLGSDEIGRQALHSWRLTFVHPVTGKETRVEAPLPTDLRAALPGDVDSQLPAALPAALASTRTLAGAAGCERYA